MLERGGETGMAGARSAAVLEALGEAVVAADRDGVVSYWNDAAARLFGRAADEALGRPVLELLVPHEMRPKADWILDRLRAGKSWTGDFLTRHDSGRVLPVVATCTPIRDDAGAVVGAATILRDISEQREAENALRQSEERLDLVRRAAQSVIWEHDVVTGTVTWSSALSDVFGYDLDEVEPTLHWWRSRIHPEDRARVDAALHGFLHEDRRYWTQEYRFRRADGTYADVFDRAYATLDESGAKGRVAGAMVDLTERRQLQDERRLLAQAGMILDLSLDYEATLPTLARLIATDFADFCILQLGEHTGIDAVTATAHRDPPRQAEIEAVAAELTASPPPASLTGRALRQGEPLLLRNVPEALRSTGPDAAPLRDLVLRLNPTSALILPIEARSEGLGFAIMGRGEGQPPFDEAELRLAEELVRRVGVAVDHARMYESELRAQRAKADFLAIMSHELRTPLTAVLGYADLLADEVSGPLNERQQTQVRRIRAGTDRLFRLIDSILSYVRLETGGERPQPRMVELAGFLERVREVAAPRATDDGIEFQVDTENAPERLFTDPDRLLQVILALLTNAFKFARNGRVRLSIATREPWVEITVRDTGPGIPAEHQPYVFNPFWQVEQPSTRRASGAGLGLSIARRTARLIGGDLEIAESSPAGTAFRVRLPLQEGP